MKIALVVKESGLGLLRDVEILTQVLSSDCQVSRVVVSQVDWVKKLTPGPLRRVRGLTYSFLNYIFSSLNRTKRTDYDLAIYLETFRPWYAHKGRFNILIPNQEWLSPDLLGGLNNFDAIWCKTQAAKIIFDNYHNKSEFLGFSSVIDETLLAVKKDPCLYLHRAGNSLLRGTRILMQTWAKHANWPKLSVIISPQLRDDVFSGELPDNIEYLQGPWNDQEFSRLMASALVHIHPTETEGYGLAISEALGYGCLVLATDAAPMNELVQDDRGVLLASCHKGEYNLGDLYEVQPDGIERAVTELQTLKPEELQLRMAGARQWYIDNRQEFELRLLKLVGQIYESEH